MAARLAISPGQQTVAAPFSVFPITITAQACDGRPLRFPATGMRLLFPHLPPLKHKQACNMQVLPEEVPGGLALICRAVYHSRSLAIHLPPLQHKGRHNRMPI